jgi:acetyl esterase/lipase
VSLDNLDPELRPFLDAYLSARLSYDAEGLRAYRDGISALFEATPPVRPASVLVEDVTTPGPDGDPELKLRIYRPASSTTVPALYWMHGGGMMIGSIDMDDALLVSTVERLGLAAVSVEYRLAPEHPDPAPVEDCYAGLAWTAAHASEYGSTPVASRWAVPALEAAWPRARRCWPGTALDRTSRSSSSSSRCSMTEPSLPPRPPTRAGSSGTATPTIKAGPLCWATATELHVYPGVFHGFDLMAPDSTVGRRAWNLRWAALTRALELEPKN